MSRTIIASAAATIAFALSVGCSDRPKAPKPADSELGVPSPQIDVRKPEDRAGAKLPEIVDSSAKPSDAQPADGFSHVIAAETAYYTGGPQQGRPPDGKFALGTKVSIVKEAGSYTRVRAENGVEAYVAADAVKSAHADNPAPAADVSGAVEAGNRFAMDLYQRLHATDGNLFFSPGSISIALAMTYAGASGDTAADMAKTLHFQIPKDELSKQMKALLALWKSGGKKPGYRLSLANRLWGQEGSKFLPEFLSVTRTDYGAELAGLDFQRDPEKARQTINHWIEDQTEKKITDLIPSAGVLRDAKLVLTNAVYFKGDWSQPFDKKRTKDEDFHVTAGQTVKAPLMQAKRHFRYAAADGLQMLELPYGDKSLSMVVLLPEKTDGLGDFEGRITFDNFRKWSSSLKPQEVVVYVPKFKTTSQFDLSAALKSMGMASAFDASAADFSGMTGGKDLFISAVLHKAYVDVNEEGTEAAAATGVIMMPTAAPAQPNQPPVFRADHPFVFLIRDNRNGAVLFLGRIVDPTK